MDHKPEDDIPSRLPQLNQFSLLFKPSQAEMNTDAKEFNVTRNPEEPVPSEMYKPKEMKQKKGKAKKDKKAPPRRQLPFSDAPVQVTGTNGFLYDLHLPRQEIFEGERYHYSKNTFSNLATASWSNEPVPHNEENEK